MSTGPVGLGMPEPPAPTLAPRRTTRQLMVGDVGVGSDHRISVQSMCTTKTHDVNSTLQQIAELTAAGHPVSHETVARLLRAQGFSLQANAKTIEGNQHPDRDGQFCYLNDQAGQHIAAGQPVISVDTKKKELVGRYQNGGA